MINVAEFIGGTGSGGAETVVKDYVLGLDRSQFNVMIIVRGRVAQSQNDRILRENAVKVISMYHGYPLFVKVIHKLNDWWYIPFQLKRIIKRENIQVLHVHLELLRYVARIRGDLEGVKLLFTCHSMPDYIFTRYKSEYRAAKRLIEDNNLQMIALNEEHRDELNAIFNIDNCLVLRNGVDFEKYKNCEASREKIREKLGIPENAFVVGHIGRFAEVKNHRLLVEVFRKVAQKRQDAFLLMIGAVSSITREVEANLHKYGLSEKYLILQNRTDIPELLKTMDVFVFPSLFEGLPIAFIEAQIAGLRCVTSDQVPKEAFISEKAISLDIQEGTDAWCSAVLNENLKSVPMCKQDEYNLKAVIKELSSLYCA